MHIATSTRLLALAAWALACGPVLAADAPTPEARQRYEQERAKCVNGQSNQDRATCLKEAGAALQQAPERTPAAGGDELARNRLQRCQALPAAERAECAARMQAGTTSGTAQQGGVIREHVSPAK